MRYPSLGGTFVAVGLDTQLLLPVTPVRYRPQTTGLVTALAGEGKS
jgi:hypothetical protein